MSYCEVDDIQSEFKAIRFDEDGCAVTEDDVESFIAQADSEIDSRISSRYAVPVTRGDSALLLLKQISTWLVTQRVKDITETKNVRPEGDQDVRTNSAAMARKMLDQIASGELVLLGAVLVGGDGGVRSLVSSNIVKRVFHKDSEDW